ncbi:MAG: sulfite exporter TauE/SafE family protein [Alphaproteobacteria bacterium]|nr:sulfite exporter TauE/SafE family protein [Alphaproteobacteria bacterium]
MIGCIGIGGVILVPGLVFLAGIPIRISISAAVAAYILSGMVATVVFARQKSIRWDMAAWLCVGATPAAFAGAWAVSIVAPLVLEMCLGLLTLLSGLNSLRRQGADTLVPAASRKGLLIIGAGTGFLSSLTGTGGPLVLVPILISMRFPVLTAVGLSQPIQLPVAIAATAGNLIYGRLDLVLAGILAATLTIGSWSGARLAHIIPGALLRRIVSVVLVLIGIAVLGNVGWQLSG